MARLQNQIIYHFAKALKKLGHNFDPQNHDKVMEMGKAIQALENRGIEFRIETYPDGSWSAESTNIEGIMTGGGNLNEAPALIKDAIFTYFEIPPQLCDESLLRSDNEPITVNQTVHVGA